MSTQTQSFLQGAIVDGKYDLRQYLGGSDRGPVFLTEFGNLRRQDAAIKLVRVRPGSAELQLSRWRLAANLSHPNLTKIFDMGRCELENSPMLYVVMEQAQENVAEIIPERALTPEEVREMLAPLLDALTYMHSKGFVHSRIRPSNIMAVGEQLKLSSDSICHLGEAEGVNQPSVYDPPEGTRAGVFPAGDIWGLGVTLVEVLTQRLPTWNAAERKDPALPESFPETFVDIVRHCLRREPRSRWTAPDIAARLPRTPIDAPVPSPRVVEASPIRIAAEEFKPTERTEPAQPAPVRQVTVEPDEPLPVWKYAIGAVAAGLLLITIFGLAKLVTRGPAAQNPAVASAEPAPIASPRKTAERPKSEASKRSASAHASETADPNAVTRKPATAPITAPAAPAAPAAARAVDSPTPAESAQGGVLHEALPEVPRSASSTITGTVRVNVKVSVDPSGNVTAAELDAPGPSRYFANLSLRAAHDWKFTPATANGSNATSTWILHFGYTNAGAKAVASQATP
jgi:TonB family protein